MIGLSNNVEPTLLLERGVVTNAPKCDIVVSEFELQSGNYVHFQINTFWERYELLIPPVPPLFFYNDRFAIK